MVKNLEGLRVVALTHWDTGPVAGQILGEWDANIVYIKRVDDGDISPKNAPF
ncbi:CoA transferase [Oscillospiraceae bacterium LTW-04]|nr:CoA transferase [Oscillospiraceae bacterium MB24-C1]